MGSSAGVCSFSPGSCLDTCLCFPKFKLSALYNSSSWLITKLPDYREVPCPSREMAWKLRVTLGGGMGDPRDPGFPGLLSKERLCLQVREESCWQLGPSAHFWSFWANTLSISVFKAVTIKGRHSITLCPLKRMWNTLKCIYWREPLERYSKFPVLQVPISAVCSTLDWYSMEADPKRFLFSLSGFLLLSYHLLAAG